MLDKQINFSVEVVLIKFILFYWHFVLKKHLNVSKSFFCNCILKNLSHGDLFLTHSRDNKQNYFLSNIICYSVLILKFFFIL